MAYAELKNSMSFAHRFIYRVVAIDGFEMKLLWEGDQMGDGELEYEKASMEAREAGSKATVRLDAFKVDLERMWTATISESRAPKLGSAVGSAAGAKGKARILYLPLEFPTWNNGGHSWSYCANLAYERAFKKLGHPFMTVNTACMPYFAQLLQGERFDQVWFHCHPRHLNDFTFRQLIAEAAPVRLMICGETVSYEEKDLEVSPWFLGHTRSYERWEPFVTHVAMVDPVDLKVAKRPAFWWKQAVPEDCVLPVNLHPRRDRAVFAGTLYPPRDRWLWDPKLRNLVERVEKTEGPTFCWLFEKSHEWIQKHLEKNRSKSITGFYRRSASAMRAGRRDRRWLRAYNLFLGQLRKLAFKNFQTVYRDAVAVVNLPAMLKTYSGRVVETMASGRPAISVRMPHAPVFDEGGILHYDTPEELASHVERLIREPFRAVAIAERARAELLTCHTVEKRAEEMLRFVESGP